MKKYFTFLFIILAFTSFSFAQNMQIGPKVGLNIASIGGDDADQILDGQSLDSKTGFTGGLFFMYQFSKMFAIQPEAYYTMKGATYSENGVDLTITLDYIEVPLLFKLIIPIEGSNLRPAIFAGPSIGFNMTAKSKVEYGGESEEDDFKDETESTEFSLAFGGGLGYMIGKNELGIDVRYILGLNTFDKSSDPWDLKNNVLSIDAYFGFALQ
jgi:hypothetical protein